MKGAPEVMAIVQRYRTAYAKGDTAQVAQFDADRRETVARVRGEKMAALRAAAGTDTSVVDAVARLESDPDSTTVAARRSAELGPLLGQLPLVEGHAAPDAAPWSATGFINVEGTHVSTVAQFSNAFQGAPALTRWLLGKRCVEMQYGFHDAAVAKQ